MSNHDTVELRWILAVIWRRIWIIIIIPILALSTMYFVASHEAPVYQSSVVLYIQPNSDPSTNNYNMIMAGQQMAITYGEVLKGASVMQLVIDKLGLKETPNSLSKKVTVEPVKNTQLINVTVIDPSAQQAALLANTLANTLIAQVKILQSERFTESIKSIQQKLDTENTTIAEIQTNIDSLNAQNVDLDVELNGQELQLGDLRSDYRALQQKQQALQLALSQLPDSVKIAEEAQVSLIHPTQSIITVMVSQPPAAAGTDFAVSQSPDQFALTFAQIVTAPPVLEATIKELDLAITADQLSSIVTVKPIFGTQLIEITVVNSSLDDKLTLTPALYLMITNSLAKNFVTHAQSMIAEPYNNRLSIIQDQVKTLSASIDQLQNEIKAITATKVQGATDLSRLNNDLANHLNTSRSLQTSYDQQQTSAANSTDTVVIADKATPAKTPIDHRLTYFLIVSALGVVVGVGFAFLSEQLDDRFRTREDLTATLGLTFLGTIGKMDRGTPELVMAADPNSSIAEDFRVLATNIRFSGLDKPLRKLLVTSPKSEDGKSMVAANLAFALAQEGLKVAIVDADLRLPRLQTIFNCDSNKGLTDVILERLKTLEGVDGVVRLERLGILEGTDGNIDGALQPTQVRNLRILTSGHIPPEPTKILTSPLFTKILDELAQIVDIVVIDSPAILAVADTSILCPMVDGVVLIVRSGHTNDRDGKEALVRLRQANAQLIGGILNDKTRHGDQHAYYRRKSRGLNLPWRLNKPNKSPSRLFERAGKNAFEEITDLKSRGK
jgi:capsular polysaccharide biosynthesis protein/MinD-like ATPase involved in chromosome partitioning or flagellar assembly